MVVAQKRVPIMLHWKKGKQIQNTVVPKGLLLSRSQISQYIVGWSKLRMSKTFQGRHVQKVLKLKNILFMLQNYSVKKREPPNHWLDVHEFQSNPPENRAHVVRGPKYAGSEVHDQAGWYCEDLRFWTEEERYKQSMDGGACDSPTMNWDSSPSF